MLFRSGRAFAGVLLLATLVAGEVADARHHVSEHGCAADAGGRDDNCTCASLHAAPFGGEGIAQAAPVEIEREQAPAAVAIAPTVRAARTAAPRAPPQG